MPTKKTEQTPEDTQDATTPPAEAAPAPKTTDQPRYRCAVRVLDGPRVFDTGEVFEGSDEQIVELLGCGAIEQVAS